MKLKTLGLLSASFVVAQLMTLNAMATGADASFAKEAAGTSVVLDDAAYQATGDKATDHKNIAGAIENTLATNLNVISFSKVHMGTPDETPYTAAEKQDMQDLLSAVKAVHANQGKTLGHIKTHIKGLRSSADPKGYIHASIANATGDAADMRLPDDAYMAVETREGTHSKLTTVFGKTGSNAREIQHLAKTHHAHHTNETGTSDDTKHHGTILGSLRTTHELQKVVVEKAAKHFDTQTKANS